ncbi:MYXO-CTERM-anchored inactivated metalloprotease [Hyalangium gracile]|uniref:MYXO-CTERM-anchored inactivated metalloprotease n=1 Tax=Hyalangium gracile TaxID=394092 RepID=UPI001CCA8F35|nr:MYXO-CTERM-anchored inactivated metalloprotease [Hyalangium gracile]
MLPLRLGSLVPLVVVFVGFGAQAQPYERWRIDGQQLCHKSRTFTYALSASGQYPTAAERSAVAAAVNAWAQAASTCSDLVFEQAPDVPHGTPIAYDGKTRVSFRRVRCADVVPPTDACYNDDSCADKYDCWEYESYVISMPRITFDQNTGVIRAALLEINASAGNLTTDDGKPCVGPVAPGCVGWDVQRVMTSAIGQALGFALITRLDSTMVKRVTWGETRQRVIDPGTLQGICELFPPGQPTPECPPLESPDGGTTVDGGTVADGGAGPDAGSVTDAGTSADGGTSVDGGAGTDGGQPGGEEEPPSDEPAPARSGCSTTPAAPLLAALVLLLGARRFRGRGKV